jgi:carbon monoxide dehydrogenase subunit G
MAHYYAKLDTRESPDDVFAYLSDFSTTQEWDPGVVEAKRLTEGEIGEGTQFRLVTRFLRRQTVLTYTVVEYDAPNAVTFRGENARVVSVDRITVEPHQDGTRLTYTADLSLKGHFKFATPLLGPAFASIGDRAFEGLYGTLVKAIKRRRREASLPAAA